VQRTVILVINDEEIPLPLKRDRDDINLWWQWGRSTGSQLKYRNLKNFVREPALLPS